MEAFVPVLVFALLAVLFWRTVVDIISMLFSIPGAFFVYLILPIFRALFGRRRSPDGYNED